MELIPKIKVIIPKIKVSNSQGHLIYELLDIVNKENIKKIYDVRREFMPIVLKDGKRRGLINEEIIVEKAKKLKKSKAEIEQKFFDSEYCRIIDYCNVFEVLSVQGKEISLMYFGSLLLDNCKKNHLKNIFDDCNKDILARIYLFIDSNERWNFIKIISEEDHLTTEDFMSFLDREGISSDLKDTEKKMVSKPDFQRELISRWKSQRKLGAPPFNWKKQETEKILREKIKEKGKNRYELLLLKLFISVDLIKEEGNLLKINKNYIENLKNKKFWFTSEELELDRFFKEIYDVYSDMIKDRPGKIIPIPELRKKVCINLKIMWRTFDKILKIYKSGYKDYTFALSKAASNRKWGLIEGFKNFYYITITMKEGI